MNMRLFGFVEKSWGYEEIIISNDLYCAKYMFFKEVGDRTSMHFHKIKHETWKVLEGKFIVNFIDTTDGIVHTKELSVGDTWENAPLVVHQLVAIENKSRVLEVSTADSVEDNYRVWR